MPSPKTASKPESKPESKPDLIECEVMRAIGIDATPETIKAAKARADMKGIRFASKGLTTMIHPNKKVLAEDKKTWIPGEPVFISLEKDVARKLQLSGAVRVNI